MYKNYSELGVQEEKTRDLYAVPEISHHQHKSQIIGSHRVVLVDIYGSWCSPCKQIEPEFSVLAAKYTIPNVCMVVKENIDKKISKNIQGVPTFHIFRDGQLVDETVGANLGEVETKLKHHLSIVERERDGFGNQMTSEYAGPSYYQKNTIRQSGGSQYTQGLSQPSGQPYQPSVMRSYHQNN